MKSREGSVSTRTHAVQPSAHQHTVVDRSTPTADLAERPLLPVVGGELVVPCLDDRSVRYVNLDYAASAPALSAVADHVAEVLPYYSSVHRGAGYTSQVSTTLYESARAQLGAFLGARTDDVTVITRNTTDALNLLATAVPSSQDVVVLDIEHHANLLPWTGRRHRVLNAADTLADTLQQLDAELAARPAALVAVTGCSNVTGELLPLAELAQLTHAHGARIAVDAAQLAPHRRIDIGALDVDYLALSGHKLYAPYGAGLLVGRRDWLDAAPAHLAGGGAVEEVGLDCVAWAPAPARHEAGTPNVIGTAALAAACRAIAALPEGAVTAHEQALVDRLLDGLGSLPGVRLLRLWPDSADRVGVVGFTVTGHDPGRLAAALSAEHGIGVRDGRFCAHPLLARLGLAEGALRASLGLGSRIEDVDRLVGALEHLLLRGEGARYRRVAGRWAPAHDTRPGPAWLGTGSSLTGVPETEKDLSVAGSSPCAGPTGRSADRTH